MRPEKCPPYLEAQENYSAVATFSYTASETPNSGGTFLSPERLWFENVGELSCDGKTKQKKLQTLHRSHPATPMNQNKMPTYTGRPPSNPNVVARQCHLVWMQRGRRKANQTHKTKAQVSKKKIFEHLPVTDAHISHGDRRLPCYPPPPLRGTQSRSLARPNN